MPSKAMTAPLQHATSHQVRTQFFSMIGMESSGAKSACNKQQSSDIANTDSTQWAIPLIQQVEKQKECLKYDRLDDRRYSPKRSRSDESSRASKKTKKIISFDETVEVVPIPAKDEYEGPVRERIWASVEEIHQNAARNTIEFISEGYVEKK
jgi:hypothetical protein